MSQAAVSQGQFEVSWLVYWYIENGSSKSNMIMEKEERFVSKTHLNVKK